MQIAGARFLVIGGAGFIGSHLVDQLLAAGAAQVRIYDNFSRGTRANLRAALQDGRTEILPTVATSCTRTPCNARCKALTVCFTWQRYGCCSATCIRVRLLT